MAEIRKMPISQFVDGLEKAYRRKDGYIMGAKGQDPKTWSKTSWWFTQYSGSQKTKALYWRENAQRVWDCNGLAEGIYEDFSGVNINTRARYNYSGWCGTKGTGSIPPQYRVPGAAVFIHSSAAGSITHVGYLYKPVDASDPSGDWYVIEARGVMYGVVKTKLNSRGWNRWGLMTKYFDYDNSSVSANSSERVLKNGMEGDDVKELQESLIRLGYDCGKWGVDGDFGDATEQAVMEFQRDHSLEVDGEYGSLSRAAMEKALAALEQTVEDPGKVRITGGSCWVRTDPNAAGAKLGVAKEGSVYPFQGQTSEDGWLLIDFAGVNAWVSGKYGRLEA